MDSRDCVYVFLSFTYHCVWSDNGIWGVLLLRAASQLSTQMRSEFQKSMTEAVVMYMPRTMKAFPMPLTGDGSLESIEAIAESGGRAEADRAILHSVSKWLVMDGAAEAMGSNRDESLTDEPLEDGYAAIRIVQFVMKRDVHRFWDGALEYTAAKVYIKMHVGRT